MHKTLSVLVLISVLGVGPAFGQSESAPQDPQTTPPASEGATEAEQEETTETPADENQDVASNARPKRDAYVAMSQRAREINNEINKLIGSMPVGFPRLVKQQTARIETLKKERASLAGQMMDAAVDAYMEAPNEDRTISIMALNVLAICMDPKSYSQKFNPELALQIAETFLEKEPTSIQVNYMGFRAAFALQDFEKARKMLDAVKAGSAENVLNDKIFERVATTEENWKRELEIRKSEAAADDLPRVKFETTSGDFVVELFENHAPDTVGNFISLVEKGFYDGLIFHLVRPGALSQSGCPRGDGKGDPGYKIACECYGDNIRHHFAGTLSMSNNGRDTGGSQFFIAHQPNPGLDGKYTVFGRVIDSMDSIYNANTVDKTRFDPNQLVPTIINKVTVLRKRNHAYVAKPLPADTTSADPATAPSSTPPTTTPDTNSGDGGGTVPTAGGGSGNL